MDDITARVEAEMKAISQAYWADIRARQSARAKEAIRESSPAPDCEVCGDLGMIKYAVPTGDERFGKFYPCPNPNCRVANQHRSEIYQRRIDNAGLPQNYRRFTFATWDKLPYSQREGKSLAYDACKTFANDGRILLKDTGEILTSMMLFGEVGTGKTGLIASTINALLEQGKAILYIRCRDLLANIQATYKGDEDTTNMSNRFRQAPILAIDEFNIENPTPDRLEIVEGLIRYRHAEQLPTLMTANVNQDEFEKMWGLRTASVLFEMACWIYVGGIRIRIHHAETGGY